jgi:hypothetical protein
MTDHKTLYLPTPQDMVAMKFIPKVPSMLPEATPYSIATNAHRLLTILRNDPEVAIPIQSVL